MRYSFIVVTLLGFFTNGVTSFAAKTTDIKCYKGTMSIVLPYDDNKVPHAAEFDVQIKMPQGDKPGRLLTVLKNADESFPYSSKNVTKVGQAASPDNLELVKSALKPGCPCKLLESPDRKVSLSIEMMGDGTVNAQFAPYFNVQHVQVENLTSCK